MSAFSANCLEGIQVRKKGAWGDGTNAWTGFAVLLIPAGLSEAAAMGNPRTSQLPAFFRCFYRKRRVRGSLLHFIQQLQLFSLPSGAN